MKYSFIAVITIAIIFNLSGLSKESMADDKKKEPLPFYPGEKLKFELRWSFIKAGEATLEILPIETVNGLQAYHFVMTAESNSALDMVYKVRDRIDAYTDINMTHSILYKKKQKEGSTERDIVVHFDWENKEAHYTNFGKKNPPVSLLPGAFDPLSAFYYTRLIDIKENTLIERAVTDGKKCIIAKAVIVKRETIKAGEKIYDTYLIEPELKHVGGVFEKSRNAKIQVWISADKRRIPVRIKSKVIVGSFIGELISDQTTIGN